MLVHVPGDRHDLLLGAVELPARGKLLLQVLLLVVAQLLRNTVEPGVDRVAVDGLQDVPSFVQQRQHGAVRDRLV
ncbi:MAG: hypothetical protein KAI24_23375, partial [Planctomycetes bacterium]|nr:hypothetical protein [Planctomycetota bacterium]